MLSASQGVPGEPRWVGAKHPINVRKRQDRRTDERTPDRYITLTAERGQRNKTDSQ